MKTSHTPGPWRALPAKDFTYENGKALKVASANPSHHSDFKFTAIVYGDMVDGRCEADAALIAAAPDLLAALENAANVLAGIATGDLKSIGKDSHALMQARAALAKARGA